MIERSRYGDILDAIAERGPASQQTLIDVAEINSGSLNVAGLETVAQALVTQFEELGAQPRREALADWESVDDHGDLVQRPLGPLLRFRRHPQAPRSVLLVGHMDTVFPADHSFQSVSRVDGRLHGPGVADLKGGLLVMRDALAALESSPFAGRIGWEVIINPDEEIGSPGSAPVLAAAAADHDLGLVFEPSLPDGTLAGSRKGSGNFAAVFRGKAAHAGREHHLGRNAVAAAAEFISAIEGLNGQRDGVTINVGFVHGGGPVNIVPDRAVVRFNVRLRHPDDQDWIGTRLDAIIRQLDWKPGFAVELHGGFTRPPKPLDQRHDRLFSGLRACGEALGQPIDWQPTGGCCDGNNLAAAGLANVDTLGVIGGNIHSAQEYMETASLTQRAQLTAFLLLGLAAGDLEWP